MVVEEVVITLSGGAPWGFRLQGGAEHKKPLQVAKVRKRSKACRAGLREADELVSINESPCGGLSHAQAMNLIDSSPGTLHIRVRRAPAGFQSVVLLTRAPSPRIDKEYRAALRAMSPPGGQQGAPEEHRSREGVTSPQGSEAYYGETDSDADVTQERHRRPRRRSPSNSPGRGPPDRAAPPDRASPEEANDADGGGGGGPGVARREVVYQPPQGEWSSSLTETSAENSSLSADDQGPRDGAAEEDSGFQEPHTLPPLVSPERARGALQLASRKQLVPMVGPVDNPVDEELTVTYMDKAKQAKLHRGDSQQEKQVKEARTKCRTIACLLTDAPNPHSKGVLMFKKRRQRSKKYTLTSFGCVEEDAAPQDSHEEEEEDGVLPGSESEFDEDGLPAAPDPTWDSDYLEALEKKASAAGPGAGEGGGAEDPGLTATSGKGAQLFEQQRRRAAEHAMRAAARQPQAPPPPQPAEARAVGPPPAEAGAPPPAPAQPPAPHPAVGMVNGDAVVVESPVAMAMAMTMAMAASPAAPQASFTSHLLASPPPSELPEMPASNVLNRTARPFAPGFISHRASTAPVVFRPNAAKKPRPAAAPMAVPPPHSSPSPFEMQPEATPPLPPVFSAQPVPTWAPRAVSAPTTPTAAHHPGMPRPPLVMTTQPISLAPPPAAREISVSPVAASPIAASPAPAPVAPYQQGAEAAAGGRTGILQDALRNRPRKALFTRQEEKRSTPNPQLLSMVQSLDEGPRGGGGPDRGFESCPEDDSFNLGAEASDFSRGRLPPPVAPKPRVVPAASAIGQGEGRGAELFARRQTRMDLYVVDNAPQHPPPVTPPVRSRDPSPTPSLPAHWKYSPNIRAPPPIGYNPLLSPSCPPVAQRGPKPSEPKAAKRGGRPQRDGIRALDAMRRQPYQLNPAMFSFAPSPQPVVSHREGPTLVGSSLSSPRQVPVKTARAYEIRRFSTPTPMSAPATLTPTVIPPRSATTLAEPLCRPDLASPPPPPAPLAPAAPPHRPAPTGALPQLPRLSSGPVQSSAPYPAPPTASSSLVYGGLQGAKQFKSAPELFPPRSATVQVAKPRFVASRMGIQANVWRPGFMHY
ncbi:synaptopodin 2-like protein [Anguilla anguilla]|uniref:synaptopodin 2-like protein n=1 Tax=Anguilla anguilla TaxID=7936 RepID=UPI0015A889C2|nr:synaptopodin 2-like protein [Anguilla anguilla]